MTSEVATSIVSVGQTLAGKYRVERVLGQGGMGVVVAARHIDLHEMRAIKLMLPNELSNKFALERFIREARAAVKLRNEHVAQVYDIGKLDSGIPYIVMELLEGDDLNVLFKRNGIFSIELACLYVTQACIALEQAHGLGIIHRDLKPANLFLTHRSDGSPCIKVLDFGISKNTAPTRDGAEAEMTGTRDVMGSPLYMAPEQMRSAKGVDPRADIWSLGAILYKLITGRAPFQAQTTPEIFALTLDTKPARPPSMFRNEVPKTLDAAILRCLDKNAARRYGKVSDLLAALMPFTPQLVLLDDLECEGETTLLRPAIGRGQSRQAEHSGTMPMGPEMLHAAMQLGSANAAAARAAVGAKARASAEPTHAATEIRDETTKEVPPQGAPRSALPRPEKPQSKQSEARKANSAVRVTLPLSSSQRPAPSVPDAERGATAPAPVSAATATPLPTWSPREPSPSSTNEARPSVASPQFAAPMPAHTPLPTAEPPAPNLFMQHGGDFAGNGASPLFPQRDPLAQSSNAWPTAPPHLAQMTSVQGPPSMSAMVPFSPQGISFTHASPGDGTGSSLPPWSPSVAAPNAPARVPKRRLGLGVALGLIALFVAVGVRQWRTEPKTSVSAAVTHDVAKPAESVAAPIVTPAANPIPAPAPAPAPAPTLQAPSTPDAAKEPEQIAEPKPSTTSPASASAKSVPKLVTQASMSPASQPKSTPVSAPKKRPSDIYRTRKN